MSTTRIAVPSVMPGGMDVAVDAHFGHCGIYTLVDVENGEITHISTLENVPHQQGGCMAPVNHLKQHGVTALIAGGMGMRPLQGFNQVGIDVYFRGIHAGVGEAVAALVGGKLTPFTLQNTCGGGEEHHCEGEHH